MAKKAKKRRSAPKLSLISLVSLAPLAYTAYDGYKIGGFKNMASNVSAAMTGYSLNTGNWNATSLKYGLAPIVLGAVFKKIIGALGVNRGFNLKLPVKL